MIIRRKEGREGEKRGRGKERKRQGWGDREKERKETNTITASEQQQQLCNLKTSEIRCGIYVDTGKSQIPRALCEKGYPVKQHGLPAMKHHLCISTPTTPQTNSEAIKAKVGIESRRGRREVHLEG